MLGKEGYGENSVDIFFFFYSTRDVLASGIAILALYDQIIANNLKHKNKFNGFIYR